MLPGCARKEINMVRIRLFQAVCSVAILAAAPAFAQGGETPDSARAAQGMATPSDNGSAGNQTMSGTHHTRARSSMRAKNDTSQDADVDQLNDKSYQAAQSGQAFSAGSAGTQSGGMSTSNGAEQTNPPPAGQNPGNGGKM